MAAPIQLSPGSVFAGDFRIERPLAEGGMGAVYVVEQLSTGARRALKVMHPTLVPDERSRARFVEEARVGAKIRSDHVVDVLAAGVDPVTGIPWLAMELLEGHDLEGLVQRRGALPPAEVLDVLAQVGHALGAAHALGIIHRDLKPENLFVAEKRQRGATAIVKILDFGIARMVEGNRTAATVTSAIGSPLWMAPEQAQPGAKLRPATDVWALGLIAFYLLTGKSYWRAANHPEFNLSALLVEAMTHPIEPPSQRARELGAAIPPGFDAWFLRCVDRDPTARFADASQAIEALAPALTGGSPLPFAPTAPVPFGGPTPPPASTMPLPSAPAASPGLPLGWFLVALVAGVALLAALGVGVAIVVGASLGDDDPSIAVSGSEPPPMPVPPAPVAATPEPMPVAAPEPEPVPTEAPPSDEGAVVADGPPAGYGGSWGGVRGRNARAPRVREGNADVRGSLSRDVIRRVVRRHQNEIRFCYEQRLNERPDLEGRVTVSMVVGPTGEVQSATVGASTLNDPPAEACMVQRIRRWRFPAPQGGGVVVVNYPFVLSTG